MKYAIFDTSGWGLKWAKVDSGNPEAIAKAGAIEIPVDLLGADARLLQLDIYLDEDEQTSYDVTLGTAEERAAYDLAQRIAAMPNPLRTAANRLLFVITDIAKLGVDASAATTTDGMIDAMDDSAMSMTAKGYWGSKLLGKWKRYHEELGGSWEMLQYGPFEMLPEPVTVTEGVVE